jgi:hypothetical protein
VKFVKGLLEMRDKFDRIVTEAFGAEAAAKKKLQVGHRRDAHTYMHTYIHTHT